MSADTRGLRFSVTGPLNSKATAAGTKVTDSRIALSRAITTVMAIGWNILPSTPSRAKIGAYTAVIINTPNNAGRMTSRVASNTSCRRSFNASGPVCWLRRRRQFSTMMMAPSTSRPKSSAPRLIRLALTRVCTIPVKVISIARGITSAVRMAARILPSIRNKITITSKAPSTRLVVTVLRVFSTSPVRS